MSQRLPARFDRKKYRRVLRRLGKLKLPAFVLTTGMAFLLPQVAKAAILTWDPDSNPGNGFGGSGIWNTTSLFWNIPPSPTDTAWVNSLASPNSALFSGTAGTIQLGVPIIAEVMSFDVAGNPSFQLTNGGNAANTLTLAGQNAAFEVLRGTLDVSAQILGIDGFQKKELGTLVLSNQNNTYSGVTKIYGGTVRIGSIANVGSPSPIGVGGDAFDIYTPFIDFSTGGVLSYTGSGAGTNRVFRISSGGGGIDASGTGASLGFSQTSGGVTSFDPGPRTFTLSGTNTALNNIASPIGNSPEGTQENAGITSVVKAGTGTWSVTALNTYSGATTITGGTLIASSIDNGGAASSLGQGVSEPDRLVLNGGTLRYVGVAKSTDRSFTLGPNGGRIEASGTGALTLSNFGGTVSSGSGNRTLTLSGSTAGNVMRLQLADPTTVWALNSGGTALQTLNPATPEVLSASLNITGMGGDTLHSIDFRPSTGELYGMATSGSPAGSVNRIYKINTATGAATLVSTVTGLTMTAGNAGNYGFDVNPVGDTANTASIRVVGQDRQNVRIQLSQLVSGPVSTSFTGDTQLAFAPGDVNAAQSPRIVGIAYSNNFTGASSTMLYGIDSNRDVLVSVNPENGGVVNTIGSLTGAGAAFSVDAGDILGFDIASNGSAYASIRPTSGGSSRLYHINLTNGVASLLGATIGDGASQYRDISVAVGGATSLMKNGPGSWTIDRSGNTLGHIYTGATTIAQGTLTLNFNQTTTPDSDLISSASQLIMNGGTLAITGKAGTALPTAPPAPVDFGTRINNQTFNGLTLLPGSSVIAANLGTNDIIDLRFGALSSRPAFATVVFPAAPPPRILFDNNPDPGITENVFDPSTIIVRLNAVNDSTGILGAWATYGGSDWAIVNSGIVGAFAGYNNIGLGAAIPNHGAMGATSNVRINSGTSGNITLAAATTTINTLDQNIGVAATVDAAAKTLRLGAVGGILVGSGRQALTIGTAANSGSLTAGGADNTAGELILLNNSSNALTINSQIVDNGTGLVALVNSGTGVTVLNGVNTYTGGTVLNSGTLRIGDNRSLSTGKITVNGSTTAPILTSTSGIGREIKNDIDLNSDLQFVDGTGTGGLVLRGVVNLTGGSRTLTVTQANGYVTLDGTITNGSLIKSGPGALAFNDIALTSVTDITLAQGSLDLWAPNGLGITPIYAVNGALSASGAFYAPVLSTIYAGGNLTLGRAQISDGIDLGGLIDLSNSTIFSPRAITAAGAFAQQQQRLSGTIVNGALSKAGISDLYITGSTSTYEGGTLVSAGSLVVGASGRLGANSLGNDIYVVSDPLVSGAPAANTFAILRLESTTAIGSNQSVFLSNASPTATPFLGWGSAFEANSSAVGFVEHPFFSFADPGLKNIQIYNQAGYPVGIALDGVRTNQDVVGKVLAGVPNADVWMGATLQNATYIGSSLSVGANSTYYLGGGGGTLTIAGANVLTGFNNVVTGSYDATARGITGTVYIPNSQDFTGALTIGSGTTFVTGNNGALGSGGLAITLAGGTLNLRSTGAHLSSDWQYAGRDLTLLASSTVNIDPLGGGQNGVVHVASLDLSNVLTAPTFTANISNNFDLHIDGSVNLIGGLPLTPNVSTTNVFTINSGFMTVEGPVGELSAGEGGANLTKQGSGTLILTKPSTYGGFTTVNGGTLVLTNVNSAVGITRLQSGTLSLRSDSASPVEFNFQTFNLTGSGTVYVGPIAPTGVARYAGTTIRISNIGAGTQTALTVTGELGTELQVVGPLTLGANFTLTTNGAPVELQSGFSGNFNFTKAGINVLTLSGGTTSTGNTVLNQGTVVANHDAGNVVDTFGDGSFTFGGTGSSGLLVAGIRALDKGLTLDSNGGNQVIGGLDVGAKMFSGDIAITSDGSSNGRPNNSGVILVAEAGGDVTFSGTISGGVGGAVTVGSLTGGILTSVAGTAALGRGNVILSPVSGTGNTFTLPVVVNNGTLIGQAQATSGSPFGNSSNLLSVGNGTLQLNGRGSNTTTTNGALMIGGGAQLVVNDPSDAFSTQFSVASLARAGVGTLTYVPLGNTGQEVVNIAGAPSLVNGILPPWIVRATSGVDRTGNFLTLNSGNLAIAPYTSGNLDSATSAQIFNVTVGGPLTLDRAVYAFKSAINVNLGGKTLAVGDALATGSGMANAAGGIILNGGAAIGSGTLNFGQAEGVIYVDSAATSTISSAITGTSGIVGVTPTDTRVATTLTNGSAVISGLPSTARLSPGTLVTGTGIPANTFISAVLSPTSVQLSASVSTTVPLSNITLTFTGDSALSKVGSGTLVISGTNTYRGGTVINEGTLRMGAVNAIGRYTNNGLLVPSAVTIGSRGALELNGFDTEIGALAGTFGSVLDIGNARLTVGRSSNGLNIPTTFSGRLLGSANAVLQKIGPGTLTLDNTRADGNASTFAGSVFIDQGALTIVVADQSNGSPFAVGNSLPSTLTLTLRGGTLNLRSSGDNTTAGQTLSGGYNLVVSGANSSLNTDRFGSAEANKDIELGTLTLGRNSLTITNGNTVVPKIMGTTTLTDNAVLNPSNELFLDGVVTDNGAGFTLVKQGGNLFLGNANNNYSGGTVITSGNLFFGTRGADQIRYTGNTFTPSDQGRAGTGPIIVETNTGINFTDRENLAPGQTVRLLNSTLAGGNNAIFVIQTDRAVSDFNLRAIGRGSLQIGVQNGTYYTPLDMSKIGDGQWGLTTGRSVETLYAASTLGAGSGNIYRFYGSSGAAFVLMEPNVVTGNSVVELGRSLQEIGTTPGNASASIRFTLGQNYTGSTLIHRTATAAGPANTLLDFRGTLASGTSASNPIEIYGRLAAVGAGTFTNSAGSQVNTSVILRPGGELGLDYNNNAINNTSFLVPVGTTSATGFLNKWGDTQPIMLDGATLRVASAPGSLTTEIIGAVTYKGAAEIFPQSTGTGGNAVVVINGTLSRVNLGTFALRSTSSQLGVSGEPGTNAGQRVVFSSLANATASGVVRGTVASGPAAGTVVRMVPARFYSNTANTFLDYDPNTVLGFSDVPFTTRLNETVFNNGGLNNGTEIIDHITNTTPATDATTVNAGADIWALRTNIDIGTSSTTNAITIRSGGLAVTDAGTIFAPMIFRNGASAAQNVEAEIWTVSGTVTLRGTVEAQNLVKTGAGTLVLAGNNTGKLAGLIQINGGALVLGGLDAAGAVVDAAQALGSATNLRLHAGNFNNSGNQMPQVTLLSNAAATYNQSITISQFVPFATLNVDRVNGSATNAGLTVSGGLTIEGGGSDGTVLAFTNGNDFDFTSSGTTTLGIAANGDTGAARIGINVTNTNGTNNVLFSGQVTGPAPLVKSGNGPLILSNTTNNFTGGIVVNAGTLELRGVATSGAMAGTGPIEVNGGTLRISTDASGIVNVANAAGNNLTVRGQSIVLIDRSGTASTTGVPTLGGDTATFTTQNSPIIQFNTAGNVSGGAWAGKTLINDSPTFNLAQTAFTLGNGANGDSVTGTGHIYKTGNNVLIFNSSTTADVNSFSGGIDVFQGQIRAATNFDRFGSGPIRISPSGVIAVQSGGNVSSNGQVANFHSTSTALAGLALRASGLAPTSFLSAGNITTGLVGGATGAGNGGLLAIDANSSATLPSQTGLFDGNWFYGSTVGATYSGASFAAGAGSTYRLGGGGATLTLGTTTNMLTGGNGVIFGKPHALAGNGAIMLSMTGGNNYTGNSIISRVRDTGGGFTVSQVNAQAGGFVSSFGTGAVDVFGTLVFEAANGAAASGSGNSNLNAITFHPGARLLLLNSTAYTGNSQTGRWADSAGVALRASSLELAGNATATNGNNSYNSETVGAVTFSGGSEIRVARAATNLDAQVVMPSLARVGTGTLTLSHTASVLGTNAYSAGAPAGTGTLGTGTDLITIGDRSGILDANGVVKPFIVSRIDNNFLRYDATNDSLRVITSSDSPVPYILNATVTGFTISPNNGTAILDNNAAAATLGANLDVYALRVQQDINPSADGQFNSITIRSGGLTIAGGTARTINTALVFGTAASPAEALIHTSSVNLTINGPITASSITKFGTSSLTINQNQAGAGAWNVNQGQLIVQIPDGLGSGLVNLNGTSGTNAGQIQTELRFVFNSGTPDELTFSSGKITATDWNIIRTTMGSVNDRTARIAAIDLKTTNPVAGTGMPGLIRFQVDNSRNILRTGAMTMFDDYVVHVDATSFGPGSTTGVRPDAVNNGGLYNLTKIGDGVLVLGDNSTTFTGSGKTLTINEGAVKALSNGSFGGAGTVGIIDNGGALEIATPSFTPVGTLLQRPGSIERWSVNGARPGSSYTLGQGVHLQVAANQSGTQTINLNGGSIMGYVPIDLDANVAFFNLGPNVSVNLQADSMLGQPYPAGTNVVSGSANHIYYDMGRQNQPNVPTNPQINGAVLDIRGNISAATERTLTKVGLDLVQLSGTNTGFNTTVREGTLVLGSSTALPADKMLTVAGSGTLDLNGFNASTATLVGSSPQGLIVNSATTTNLLTVNGGTSYAGGLSGNLGIVKAGAADFTLSGTLAHSGPTTVMTGKLILTGSATGTTTFQVNSNATLDVSGVAGGFQLLPAQTMAGGVGSNTGTVLGSITAKSGSTIAPGFDFGQPGKLTLGNGIAVSNLTLESGSHFKLELAAGPTAGSGYDQLVVANGTVNLAGSLDATVAFDSVLPGEVYYIIQHGTGTNTGQFAGLPQLSFFSINGYEFQISYTADFGGTGFASGTGNDVALLVTVPEPGSFAGLCAGLGSLLGLRRFRRRA